MIFYVSANVFDQKGTDEALLLALIVVAWGDRGQLLRHELVPQDVRAAKNWASKLHSGLKSVAEQTFDRSILEVGRRSLSTPRVLVVCANDTPCASGPTPVTLNDALALATRPLEIWLEDFQSDRGFLECAAICVAKARFRIEQATRLGWLRFRHGGGLPGLRRQAMNFETSDALRAWSMIDSDCQTTGIVSAESKLTEAALLKSNVPVKILRRRSIESYLPLPAIELWAEDGILDGPPNDRSRRYQRVKSMNHNDRFVADLKFELASNISHLFRAVPVPWESAWFRNDGSLDEIREIIASMLERL